MQSIYRLYLLVDESPWQLKMNLDGEQLQEYVTFFLRCK